MANTTGGHGVAAMPSNQWFRLAHVKFLLKDKNFIYGEYFPNKNHLEVPGGL